MYIAYKYTASNKLYGSMMSLSYYGNVVLVQSNADNITVRSIP